MHTTFWLEAGRKKPLEKHICRVDGVIKVDYNIKCCVSLVWLNLDVGTVRLWTFVYTHVIMNLNAVRYLVKYQIFTAEQMLETGRITLPEKRSLLTDTRTFCCVTVWSLFLWY